MSNPEMSGGSPSTVTQLNSYSKMGLALWCAAGGFLAATLIHQFGDLAIVPAIATVAIVGIVGVYLLYRGHRDAGEEG